MSTGATLHAGYEQLMGAAAVDAGLRMARLADPGETARRFGLSAGDAAIVALPRATDLGAFAAALPPRLYGGSTGCALGACAVVGHRGICLRVGGRANSARLARDIRRRPPAAWPRVS